MELKTLPKPYLRGTVQVGGTSLGHSVVHYSADTSGKKIKGRQEMDLLKRLWVEEDGQGLVEYTLVAVLVALVFWMGVRNTNVGSSLASGWSRVLNCVASPLSCST